MTKHSLSIAAMEQSNCRFSSWNGCKTYRQS